MNSYKTTLKPIDDLIPYANNSRLHSAKQISQVAASIKEFGFTTAILIDEGNSIIAGHCRVEAARKLGLTEVPCTTVSGLTKAQVKALVISDNSLALASVWDTDILKLEVESLNEMDFDTELLGFDDDFLDELLNGDGYYPESNDGDDDSDSTGNPEDDQKEFNIIVRCLSEEERVKIFNELVRTGINCQIK